MRAILALGALWTFVLAAALAAFLFEAHAHGDAWWIEQGKFKSAEGSLCCGEQDCKVVPSDDVMATRAGYYIKSLKETIPYSEAQPSPDGQYWRCAWPRLEDRKCWFAPPPGS
jgi:hypothetical protein